MKKSSHKPYLILIFSAFLLMSLPKKSIETLRGSSISILAPFWESIVQMKLLGQLLFEHSEGASSEASSLTLNEELERLRLENQLLRHEISKVAEVLRHQKNVHLSLSNSIEVIPARIIFRSTTSWNSSVWVNVGKSSNDAIGKQIIVKNSPVLAGTALVGVVDYVGENQSRIRLITDSGLNPSVRVSRGSHLLAKGELHGYSDPLWRSPGHTLHGIGFNYDFADEQGPARDLRTGEIIDSKEKGTGMALLKVNDLLVTTGMDGVFPPGLPVATVTKINPLKEGDYYYELEAKPLAQDLNNLSLVFILSPVGYDPMDKPAAF
jgi:rod shape-determining protein MreC